MKHNTAVYAAVLSLAMVSAHAEVKVGVITSANGPLASIGIPLKNTFSVLPATLGGEPVTYLVLDDAGDLSTAARLARKLVTDDKVDLLIGPSGSPTASSASYVASETKTPQIALAPITGDAARNPWVFTATLPTIVQMKAVAEDMKANGVKTVGYIGFADSWGDQVYSALNHYATEYGYKVVSNERYARLDTSVTSQALKVVAMRPDAVFLGGAGSQGALPNIALVERGFKGRIYHTGAVVNPEFMRIGGKAIEGAFISAGPFVAADQLPDSNPIKKVALNFTKDYEAKFGPGSKNAFAAYSYDAFLVADKAVSQARLKAKPGTPEFRSALRDAIEATKEVVGAQGVYSMSSTDHAGNDLRSVVLLRVANGTLRLAH